MKFNILAQGQHNNPTHKTKETMTYRKLTSTNKVNKRQINSYYTKVKNTTALLISKSL